MAPASQNAWEIKASTFAGAERQRFVDAEQFFERAGQSVTETRTASPRVLERRVSEEIAKRFRTWLPALVANGVPLFLEVRLTPRTINSLYRSGPVSRLMPGCHSAAHSTSSEQLVRRAAIPSRFIERSVSIFPQIVEYTLFPLQKLNDHDAQGERR